VVVFFKFLKRFGFTTIAKYNRIGIGEQDKYG